MFHFHSLTYSREKVMVIGQKIDAAFRKYPLFWGTVSLKKVVFKIMFASNVL